MPLRIIRKLGNGIVNAVFHAPIIDSRQPQNPTLPMKFYVPWCIHLPTTNPSTGTDGFGNPTTGAAEPLLDTLIAIANPINAAQLQAIVQVFNANGVVQNWSGQPSKSITLDPGHSVALTFIQENPYADAPQNFEGYAVISLSHFAGVTAGLGGGGYFPSYWNTISAEIPVFGDSPVIGYSVPLLQSRNAFLFPYSIPYFDDLNHHLANSYRIKMVLTNVDTQDCYAHIGFTIDDFYPNAGTIYKAPILVPANKSRTIDLYAFLQANAGYPANTLAEGNVTVTLRATANPNDPLVNRNFLPYMLVTNRDVTDPTSFQPNAKLQFGFSVPFF